MSNNYFKFKQFRINQEGSAMKVGTDGVLLGAWTEIDGTDRILDIGTGSGLIAIMLAQRTNVNAKIDAVEIDDSAYEQAFENINNCLWSHKIHAYHLSFQDFCNKTEANGYDRIVSNPPYFMNGLNAKGEARTKARSANHLPFEELVVGAKKLLKPTGTLSVILPIEEGEYFERIARLSGFYARRKVSVLPNPGKPAKRYLLEFSLQEVVLQDYSLAIENGQRHVYTAEYMTLTKDFYLKF